MKIEYDREVDAVYIYLQQKQVVKTIELSDVVKVDLDEEDNLIGIEVLDATQRYSLADIFNISTENLILDEGLAAWVLGCAISPIALHAAEKLILSVDAPSETDFAYMPKGFSVSRRLANLPGWPVGHSMTYWERRASLAATTLTSLRRTYKPWRNWVESRVRLVCTYWIEQHWKVSFAAW
jgi:uncharacterized protein YuzE